MEGYAMPLDAAAATEEKSVIDESRMQPVFARMSEADRAIFTERHHRILEKACSEIKWGDHPVNIRWSIPTLLSRYYVVLLAGPEKRDAARRAQEKKRHPFARLGNLLFLSLTMLLVIYLGVFLETLFFIGYYKFFGG
jgi:hypothetical protein